jgi:predicted enzyme related to lactoylglutathione lyase
MGQAVVHFEIIGTAPEKLRDYYGGLFGWEFDTPSPVAAEVSDGDQYGFLELVTGPDGSGIRGGVGGGPGRVPHAIVYVGVPDVEDALRRAVELGGTRAFGPVSSPSGLVIGQFLDPEGTGVGIAQLG